MKAVVDRLLRAFSLVVTDRRWTATLSAAALGFGLFVGVAVGPNAAGTLAGTAHILEMPVGDEGREPEPEAEAPAGGLGRSLGEGGGGGLAEAPPAPAPIVSPAPEAPAPAPESKPGPEPAPQPTEPAAEEGEEETELKGVVVHANPAAGSYALAIAGGELVPVHARELPAPGERLTVTARRLANGTFAETKAPERHAGKSAQASFRGVVTYAKADPLAPAYTVSGRGASLLVHVAPDPSGALPSLPVLGARVTVAAAIGERLDQRSIEVEEGEPSTYLDLSGAVQAVLPETAQLILSADGSDESEADLVLTVPSRIALGKVELGASYLATAEVQPDGSLSLAGLASDEHTKGAEDTTATQGDLKVD